MVLGGRGAVHTNFGVDKLQALHSCLDPPISTLCFTHPTIDKAALTAWPEINPSIFTDTPHSGAGCVQTKGKIAPFLSFTHTHMHTCIHTQA